MVRPICLLLLSLSAASAWAPTCATRRGGATVSSSSSLHAVQQQSRLGFFQTVAGSALAFAVVVATQQPVQAATEIKTNAATTGTLPNGVEYTVLKKGASGIKPDVGELVAIRFAAYNGDVKIDDIFDTPEPYYTRLGSGGLIAGVEQTLPLMQLGDRWRLTIPGDLAFGSKGRPASAGKPRIPGGATIVFEVEMVGLPGKEPELIELIGDF